MQLPSETILGVKITNEKEENILEYIFASLQANRDKFYIVTPNPEIIVYANSHKAFQSTLNNAQVSLPDGIGVILAAKVLGKGVKHRITGVEFLQSLCKMTTLESKRIVRKPITVGFLGGSGNVAEKAAKCLEKKYPGLQVVFAISEWGQEGFENAKKIFRYKDTKILRKMQDDSFDISIPQYPNIDILFVAFGFPKQEQWMAEYIDKLPVKVMVGVGGAFDYISGNVPRAPQILRTLGLEWLFRLIVQPWRIKRQLSLLTFLWLVFKTRLSK